MAHISPSSEIINAYNAFNDESEIKRTQRAYEVAIADKRKSLETIQSLIQQGHTLGGQDDRLLDLIFVRHSGDASVSKCYETIDTLYQEAEGQPFVILQFWQG